MVGLGEGNELEARELLHIVNAQNNERMFFADTVLLVEGITDRLVLERLLETTWQALGLADVAEVIDVGGKGNLSKYREFLSSKGVSTFMLADLDYLDEIGDEAVKKALVVDWKAIDKNVLKNKKSEDARSLSGLLDAALAASDFTGVRDLWKHIKGRHLKLPSELDAGTREHVRAFLERQRADGVYVLEQGRIEDYLPAEQSSMDAVLALTQPDNFRQWLSDSWGSSTTQELVRVALAVAGLTPTQANAVRAWLDGAAASNAVPSAQTASPPGAIAPAKLA